MRSDVLLYLGEHDANVYKLLCGGVAFKMGDHYELFSHDGDLITDNLLIVEVESLVGRLRKRFGISPAAQSNFIGVRLPAFTYAYE